MKLKPYETSVVTGKIGHGKNEGNVSQRTQRSENDTDNKEQKRSENDRETNNKKNDKNDKKMIEADMSLRTFPQLSSVLKKEEKLIFLINS